MPIPQHIIDKIFLTNEKTMLLNSQKSQIKDAQSSILRCNFCATLKSLNHVIFDCGDSGDSSNLAPSKTTLKSVKLWNFDKHLFDVYVIKNF